MFNATVLDIQVKLNKKNVSTPGWVALKEDGKYGTNTKKALSDYLIAKKAAPVAAKKTAAPVAAKKAAAAKKVATKAPKAAKKVTKTKKK